jgi:hypothetical protein
VATAHSAMASSERSMTSFIDYLCMFVKMVQYYTMYGYCKMCYIQIVKVRKKCFLHYSCICNIAGAII